MKPSRRPKSALALCAILACCARREPDRTMTPAEFAAMPWEEVVRKARGTEVGFGMWAGDEDRNRLFRSSVSKRLKDDFGITLRIVPNGDTAEAVNKLLNEKGAGKTAGGSIDVLWINGENFRTAKQAGVLWGPFSEHLLHISLYDPEVRQCDFGTLVDGLEAAGKKADFVLAYDSARFTNPPDSIEALRAWIKAHPGRFTYIAPPDYTGSVFIRLVLLHLGKGDPDFWTGFHEGLYQRAAAATIAYLNDVKPFLWRRGETYPSTQRELDRMFANSEVDFAMNYNPAFASVRIAKGKFAPTTRTFLFKDCNITNYSFLTISFNLSHITDSLITINALMSFDQAVEFARTLDSPFPHRLESFSPAQRAGAEALPRGPPPLPILPLSPHFPPQPTP